ncbi:MAG: hypothetical protein GXO88_05080 [Chlorobi bacterium]|nr:hypothetical protein [Chlorobiota bacterium]
MANRDNIGNSFASSKKEKTNRNNHVIFIICIFIAAFFWILIKLSDVYTDIYTFGISYVNPPDNQHLTTLVDSVVKISINATGFEMLKLNLRSDSRRFNIDLSQCDINNRSNNEYFINTSTIKDKIADDLGIATEKIDISLQKLAFKMEKLSKKEVGIYNNTELKFAPQFDLYSPITIKPDKIIIYGPKDIIDTIDYIFTEKKVFDNINKDIDENLRLVNPLADKLHLSVHSTNIQAGVEKFTESSLEIPIDLSNTKYNLKAFPPTVKVFFTVALRDFSDIRKNQFKVLPNVEGIDVLKANKLQLKIGKSPKAARTIRLQPAEIEFLILK